MAQVRIESGDLISLAGQMQGWLSQMEQVRKQMIQRVRGLENSWNDPQYHMFLENLMMISNTLKGGVDSLETMRRTLLTMAREMEQQAQTFQRGMQNVRNPTRGW
jgi:hypothetical protein